jgi:hypothetical protein
MSNEESTPPRSHPLGEEGLSQAETDFLDFLADRALAEWLKQPPENDNDAP